MQTKFMKFIETVAVGFLMIHNHIETSGIGPVLVEAAVF